MKFKKEELHFLQVFALYSDNSYNGNKLRFIVEDDKIYFSQFSINSKLIYVMDNVNNYKNCEHVFETTQLNSLLQLCKEGSEIEINNNQIIFNDGATYGIKDYDYEDMLPKYFIDKYDSGEKFNIVDLSKLNKVSPFIGKEKGYNTIAIMDNHFVTFNNDILAFVDTENNIKEGQLLSSIIPLIKTFDLNIVEISNIENEFYCVNMNTMYAFFEIKDHHIPFIFKEDVKEMYEHTNKLTVNTKDFLNKINRINVVSKQNIDDKVSLICKNNELVLKNIGDQFAEEIISATIDSELINFYVNLKCFNLLNVVKQIESENVEIWITPDKENINTITIKENNLTYVIVLIEYDEE